MIIEPHRCGDGGTTHSACECVIARMAKLEAALEKAYRCAIPYGFNEDPVFYCRGCRPHYTGRLVWVTDWTSIVHKPECPLAKPVTS